MDRVSFLANLSVSEINFVHTYVEPKENYPFKNQGRRHNGFIYTVEGTETYNFEDKSISTPPGSVLYIPKGEKYTIDLTGNKSIAICLDFESSDTPTRPFCIKFPKEKNIESIFGDMEKLWFKNNAESISMIKSHLFRMLALMIRRENTYSNSKNYDKIKKAVDYLHEHYLENTFRIDSLFQIAEISPRYFETLFYKEFTLTPKEYIIGLKINAAKELLKSEKISVGDVALKVGYSDVYHFSKLFKSKTGHTPTEFQKMF